MKNEKLDESKVKEMLKEAENLPDEEIGKEKLNQIAIEATKKMLVSIENNRLERTVKHWGPIYNATKIQVGINQTHCSPRVVNDRGSTMNIHASIVRVDGDQTVKVLSPGESLSAPVSTHRYVWAAISGLGGASQYAFGQVDW